jgi:predicted ATP-dependent endonuclease of OLD family
MRLTKAHVQNYRPIVDSGAVDIEDGVTVVIGKNEQGKTNFLRGIRSFNSDQQFTPSDLPNHLRPALEDRPAAEIPIITLTFSMDSSDRKKLSGVVNGLVSAVAVKCTKYYDNHYQFWIINSDGTEAPLEFTPPDISAPAGQIKQTVADLKVKLQAHGQRVTAFAANQDKIEQMVSAITSADFRDPAQITNIIKTFTTSLKTLTATDQPVLDDITAATTALEAAGASIQAAYQHDNMRLLKQALPTFILHSTKSDQIPNEVNVADFVANPDATSKGMSNLCLAAGLSVQKIRELAATTDVAERETYEDHYKGMISGGLNEFWTQAEYDVHFRIDKERLSVSISDGKYTQRIPPSDRSEGFQWYLSFYATLLNDVGVTNEKVLLLDNPGLELHLDGQRDIKRFLEERVALTSQVVYVTYSPAMIEAFNLRQVRTVELHGNQNGTKVSNFTVTDAENVDLLEPVRAAIGMSLVTSLVMNEWNILVEGAADKPIVEGIFYQHYRELQSKILVNGSLAESKDAFLARFYDRTGLPYVVLLDADNGGRDLFRELRRIGIPEEKIIQLNRVFPDRLNDFAMEDILSADSYHSAVVAAYPANPIGQPAAVPGKKRATLYDEAFRASHNIGFNKKRVAEAAKKLLAANAEDVETRDNLGTLGGVLIEALKRQIPAAPMPPAAADAGGAGARQP